MEERDYWLGFSAVPGIGPKRFSQLLIHFTTAEFAWKATKIEKQKVIGEKIGAELDRFTKEFSIKDYIFRLEQQRVSFLTLADSSYPKLLKETDNPPFVLYVRGEIDFSSERTVGIVGTRKITSYGNDVTEMLTHDLVQNRFCIVSGLALGVDAIAHRTAIENDGKTIAVLGCGVDVCYPSSNQHIYNSILDGHGAVVSEYPLGATPSVGSFPSRNRIIAGLSEAVIVTEGAADSGALITADQAIKNNRPVFAVPGQITSSLAKGPLSLIQKGAKIVTSADDILKELQITSSKSGKEKEIKGETNDQQKIIEMLQNESMHVNDIGKQVGMSFTELSSLLSLMELKGFVRTEGDGKYSLCHSI